MEAITADNKSNITANSIRKTADEVESQLLKIFNTNNDGDTIQILGKVPPIFIDSTSDSRKILNGIGELIGRTFYAKSVKEQLKIIIESVHNYRTVIKYLKSKSVPYKTFNSNIRCVIKNIPANVSETEIEEELESLGFTYMSVRQFVKSSGVTSPVPLPIFQVDLGRHRERKKIFELTTICKYPVQIEEYKKIAPITQCFNCQRFGHSSKVCHRPSRCLKCGKDHATSNCKITKGDGNKTKCCNCNGKHTANFRGCPAFPKTPLKKSNKAKRLEEYSKIANCKA